MRVLREVSVAGATENHLFKASMRAERLPLEDRVVR